jgi:ATP-binding cassette subfamily B protein
MSTLISKFKNHLFLLKYTSNFKKDIFLALFFILIATLSILYVGFIIKSLVESLSHSSNSKEIMYFFSLLIGSIIVSSLAVFGRIYFFGQLGEKLIKDLRDSLFQHLLGQDIFFFESHRTGELVSRIMSDTHVIQIVLIGSASSAVRNGIMLLGSSIMMLLISPLLFLILCIGSGLIAIPSIFLGKKIRHFSKNAQTKSADICAHIEETINSIKTIKANCYEGENTKEFHKKTLAECLAVCKRIIYFGFSVASASFLSFFLLISVVYFAYHNLDLYNLSASKLSAFAYYGIISGYTLSQLNDLISDFYRATGASDRDRKSVV